MISEGRGGAKGKRQRKLAVIKLKKIFPLPEGGVRGGFKKDRY